MTTAQRIVIVYGVASIAYGFVLGIPLSRERMGSPTASRHLVIAHLSSIEVRSIGWRCFAASSTGHLTGISVVLIGVVKGI